MRVILRGYEPTVVFGLGQWESRHDNLFQRQAVNYPMSWTSKSLLSTQRVNFKDYKHPRMQLRMKHTARHTDGNLIIHAYNFYICS